MTKIKMRIVRFLRPALLILIDSRLDDRWTTVWKRKYKKFRNSIYVEIENEFSNVSEQNTQFMKREVQDVSDEMFRRMELMQRENTAIMKMALSSDTLKTIVRNEVSRQLADAFTPPQQ